MFDCFFSPAKDNSQSVSKPVANENIGFGFFETFTYFFQADGRVNNDGDDAEFEQRECQSKELCRGRGHQNGAHVWG